MCRQKAVDKLTLGNSTDSGKSRVPNFKWVSRQNAVEWLTRLLLSFFLESFYFFLSILENGTSLLVVDKLTLENSTDSGKSRGPNFKWVCRLFLSFFHESFYFFLETLILGNGMSLLGVDKLTLENIQSS